MSPVNVVHVWSDPDEGLMPPPTDRSAHTCDDCIVRTGTPGGRDTVFIHHRVDCPYSTAMHFASRLAREQTALVREKCIFDDAVSA